MNDAELREHLPALGCSGVSVNRERTPYSTAADFAAYAAARMNAAGGMEDIEAVAENGVLVLKIRDVPAWRAEFRRTSPTCDIDHDREESAR